ncbi:DExH-box splicing factor binding site-domain-containing protein [Suillus subalutaceus]|uniref:DExH-box splicing factor binding site-domain-containing protein n=1 Tax=Suillus subalutaceus TaxID=48586 RepID=UPI001B87A8F3|nr:DExH-box splicing factor binding site-domain-containing protein [Suillus subalutaceus]KAG1854932.1 DExH-box splicing factor binding site-domain-containing protein [Suillus subalutaceus]
MHLRSEGHTCCILHDDVQVVIHCAQGERQIQTFSAPSSPLRYRQLRVCFWPPRTFSSREDSDDEEEPSGIVFVNCGRKDESDYSDDHDEDDRLEDELITSFNKFGAQRCVSFRSFQHFYSSQKAHVLLISSSRNPDRREAARFIPDSEKENIGADLSGIQFGNKKVQFNTSTTSIETNITVEEHAKVDMVEETDDQNALRVLLAEDMDSASHVDTILVPPSETDTVQQDVADIPDVATIDDYARVPITAFGAAMLRGMGWVDGGAVTSSERAKDNALVEPCLPKSRPALLGIGAKEQEVLDYGSEKRRGDDKWYIPLVRQEISRQESRNGGATVSRRASRSPERRNGAGSSRRDDNVILREKVIAIGDQNATVTIEETYQDDRRRSDSSERDRDLDRRGRDRDVDKRHDRVRDYDDRHRRRDWDSTIPVSRSRT